MPAFVMQAFDELLLMKIGGRIIYHGGLGRQSAKLVDYLEVSTALRLHISNIENTLLGCGSLLVNVIHFSIFHVGPAHCTLCTADGFCRQPHMGKMGSTGSMTAGDPRGARPCTGRQPCHMDAASLYARHAARCPLPAADL